MFKNKLIQPLLFLVIAIILFLIINKNNLFKDYISDINYKYDHIIDALLQNGNSNIPGNFNENQPSNNIQDNILNNLNDNLFERYTEDFEFLHPIDSIKNDFHSIEKTGSNLINKGTHLIENTASHATHSIEDTINNIFGRNKLAASSLGNLNPDEQTLVNQFYDTNNKLGDKKYLIDKQATYDNESLNILTTKTDLTREQLLLVSCINYDAPACTDNYNNDSSIKDKINNLNNIKTKLTNALKANSSLLKTTVNAYNTESQSSKNEQLNKIATLQKTINTLHNNVNKITKEESQIQTNLTNQINTNNQLKNTTQSLMTQITKLGDTNTQLQQKLKENKNNKDYDIYPKVMSFGNYTTSKNSLRIQAFPDLNGSDINGCYSNLKINKATELCNSNNDCDGFYSYGEAPGETYSNRTCFKKNVDLSQKIIKNENQRYPKNGTFLKQTNSSKTSNCKGTVGVGTFKGMPCHYGYDQVLKGSDKSGGNRWCQIVDGNKSPGCVLKI